jgi:hypothetical protein
MAETKRNSTKRARPDKDSLTDEQTIDSSQFQPGGSAMESEIIARMANETQPNQDSDSENEQPSDAYIELEEEEEEEQPDEGLMDENDPNMNISDEEEGYALTLTHISILMTVATLWNEFTRYGRILNVLINNTTASIFFEDEAAMIDAQSYVGSYGRVSQPTDNIVVPQFSIYNYRAFFSLCASIFSEDIAKEDITGIVGNENVRNIYYDSKWNFINVVFNNERAWLTSIKRLRGRTANGVPLIPVPGFFSTNDPNFVRLFVVNLNATALRGQASYINLLTSRYNIPREEILAAGLRKDRRTGLANGSGYLIARRSAIMDELIRDGQNKAAQERLVRPLVPATQFVIPTK